MESMRVGVRRRVFRVPAVLWRAVISRSVRATEKRVRFLSPEHHRVRDFATLQVARTGRTLSVEEIAAKVGLPPDPVAAIVEELESAKTFLFRDARGDVEWVYPVTAADTPHRVRFSTGEDASAA